ncbi:NADH-quinone oxidoreductase subunit K [Azohydromonas aeria]|uniref:NADH-quinone oxidoreductase subunit K n=1 Tax=Azohydromonas aeria TaxID=2590212 RepID=UPI0012FA4346|nr:NADH-quinone oxidoreductase subunit K [Azohydromonas aeria]
MIWAFAVAVWAALAAGVYLALSRDVLRCVVGLALSGAAVNLLLLAAGRLGPAQPALVPSGATVLDAAAANPLPQALVLTAIVIGLALLCFALVLVRCLVRDAGSDDALALRHAEPVPDHPVKPPLEDGRVGVPPVRPLPDGHAVSPSTAPRDERVLP